VINLGDKVRDTISGFTGIVTGRYVYLHGCVRCGVHSQELKDGKPVEGQVFDEGQLELLQAGALLPAPAPTGGPRDDDPPFGRVQPPTPWPRR